MPIRHNVDAVRIHGVAADEVMGWTGRFAESRICPVRRVAELLSGEF